MDGASDYRERAEHLRRLAEMTWQCDLEGVVRSLAQDYRRSPRTSKPAQQRFATQSCSASRLSITIAAISAAEPQTASPSRQLLGTVYPAVQNMLLAARALGLGATLTTLYLQFERGRTRAAAELPFICPAADRLPHWPVRAGSPCPSCRCRLRSVG
jgi:nitroreductase